jgi:hypothetical protein
VSHIFLHLIVRDDESLAFVSDTGDETVVTDPFLDELSDSPGRKAVSHIGHMQMSGDFMLQVNPVDSVAVHRARLKSVICHLYSLSSGLVLGTTDRSECVRVRDLTDHQPDSHDAKKSAGWPEDTVPGKSHGVGQGTNTCTPFLRATG